VQNIGNGVALNVSYRFEPVDPPHGRGLKGNRGYLQNVLADQKIRMPLPVAMIAAHWEVSFEFDSLGGRRYETTITLKARVLTDFKFIEIDKPVTEVRSEMQYLGDIGAVPVDRTGEE